ncbi:Rz1-like lysis system protein LysC [Kluyvera ascorbata]|uniref:Rz1-like lysis system protein LysC n=1 Tax=Kluyvera ascorbata TaxID=51288 RepID=UPI003B834E7E
MSMCLMVLLTGCGSKQIQYEAVKVRQPPIPANLLAEPTLPDIPKPLPYGVAVLLIPPLLGAINQCYGSLRAIGKIEELRSKQ